MLNNELHAYLSFSNESKSLGLWISSAFNFQEIKCNDLLKYKVIKESNDQM